MYLAKIEMTLTEPAVRAALRDSQKMHRLVTGLYDLPRREAKLLYRVRTTGYQTVLYLYAGYPIDRNRVVRGMRLSGERDVTAWVNSFQSGQSWHFDLLTMPFKKVSINNNGNGNSRRCALRTQEERLAWLSRKAEQNGFEIISIQESAAEKMTAVHSAENGGALYLDTFRYSGTLIITDALLFRHAVENGVGPNKAYGLGMLLLRK